MKIRKRPQGPRRYDKRNYRRVTTAWLFNGTMGLFRSLFYCGTIRCRFARYMGIASRKQYEPATFSQLEEFFDGRTRALEIISTRPEKQTKSTKSVNNSKPAARVYTANSNTKCVLCNDNNYISRCPDFSGKSLAERREFVNSKRLCFNCLCLHKVSEYRIVKRCRLCNGQHHTLLHNAGLNNTAPANASSLAAIQTVAVTTPVNSVNAMIHSGCSQTPTLLATAQIQIVSAQGQRILARALLDQGSELSSICESFAQLLRLPRHHVTVPILGIGSRSAGST